MVRCDGDEIVVEGLYNPVVLSSCVNFNIYVGKEKGTDGSEEKEKDLRSIGTLDF